MILWYKAFPAALAISLLVFTVSAFASGTIEIHAPGSGTAVRVYRAGTVDENGDAHIYSWYKEKQSSRQDAGGGE